MAPENTATHPAAISGTPAPASRVTAPVAPGRVATPAARWANDTTATAAVPTAATRATTAPPRDGWCRCSHLPASRATITPARMTSHPDRASVPRRVTLATPGALARTQGWTEPITSRMAPTATSSEMAAGTHGLAAGAAGAEVRRALRFGAGAAGPGGARRGDTGAGDSAGVRFPSVASGPTTRVVHAA